MTEIPAAPVPPRPRLAREMPKPRAMWPRVVIAGIVVAGALVSAAIYAMKPLRHDDDAAGTFCAFPPGTTWTYVVRRADKEHRTVATVVAAEAGQVTIEERDESDGQTRVIERRIENGVMWEGAAPIYSIGAMKGRTWPARSEAPNAEYRHLGVTEVRVPGGVFADAINIRLELKLSVIDRYYARGIGLVCEEEIVRADPANDKPGGRAWVKELVECKRK